MKKTLKLKDNRGITLVEILVATFVLMIGTLSGLKFFVGAVASTKYAEDLTIASTHAEYVFEEMKTRGTRSEITQEDPHGGNYWDNWAESEELKTLPGEEIEVVYPGPDGVDSDPLEIELTVRWDKRGVLEEVEEKNSFSLATQVTD